MAAGGARVAAVDLGATSVRVAVVDLAASAPRPEVVHRWAHGPVAHDDGTMRWDWAGILAAVEAGLDRALASGPIASIGVDGWGVDHALFDAHGQLVTAPFSYRDERTADWQATADRIGREDLYARTGVQLMPINTVFQLAAHDPEELAAAARIVLLPDLVVHHLTGHLGTERSNATTTALVSHATGDWDDDLLAAVGVRRDQLPPIESAGSLAGRWRGVPVHTVGSHDTASAFLGAPGIPGPAAAVVSSGTWVLVGAERPRADVSGAASAANFSNEGGAVGGVRLLKNVVGFWVLERCRAAWGDTRVEELVAAAADVEGDVPVVDLDNDSFLSPDGVEEAYRSAAGLVGAPRAVVVRSIVESIAAGAAKVVAEVGEVTGVVRDEVLHVGGATRMELFNERLAARTGLPVRVGSPEAAAIGNALLQGVALGVFADVDAGRLWAGASARVVGGTP